MKLTRINTLLLIAIVLINGYVIVLPVLPGLFFDAAQHGSVQKNQLATKLQAGTALQENTGENRVIIPSMLLDQPIVEGRTAQALKKGGLWHRPQTSTPDQGGNTVLVGHRFTYTNPRGSLYHLDKVKVGDSVGMTWNSKSYIYTVREVKIVPAAAIEIEAPTQKPQLTIYTCTPLWLPRDRLVVIAVPEKKP